jgi:hypothetical protein
MDVLANYTTYKSYFGLIKKVVNDPHVPQREAAKPVSLCGSGRHRAGDVRDCGWCAAPICFNTITEGTCPSSSISAQVAFTTIRHTLTSSSYRGTGIDRRGGQGCRRGRLGCADDAGDAKSRPGNEGCRRELRQHCEDCNLRGRLQAGASAHNWRGALGLLRRHGAASEHTRWCLSAGSARMADRNRGCCGRRLTWQEHQDRVWIGSLNDQMGHTMGDGVGLARPAPAITSSGDAARSPVLGLHGSARD